MIDETKKLIADKLGIPEEDVLTAKEAAGMLDIQHRSVLKAMSRGRLEAGQVGGRRYTTRQAVEQYKEETRHD